MKIKYIGYYHTNQTTDAYISPAAVEKMTYIADSLEKNGYEVEIISLSGIGKKAFNFRISEENKRKIIYLSSLPRTNGLFRFINNWWLQFGLFCYLMRYAKKNDILLIYHSVAYAHIWRIIQKLKKCIICLEVEEIYQDAQELGNRHKKREYQAFEWADSYIFSTNLLEEKLNAHHKKQYIIVHGNYKVQEEKANIFVDDYIHVVYAGTFNQKKGGAIMALEAGKYLGRNYHLHIIGFGTKKEIDDLIQKVHENSRTAQCKITYDGCKMGEEYIQFIQSCHVGLSTQKSDNELNDTSFPSKILSYLSNDLNVVTGTIKVVQESAIGDIIFYYTTDEPNEIAGAIEIAAQRVERSGKKRIYELDRSFVTELGKMFEKLR
ncbi:MAG: hypothetical protein QM657_02720 [Lacrimispora sp.]|uniref:hypothetical protein n=1 Tax=Lacrimispora sp. TaxID=2719234 RepID=UPI0039E397BE